MPPRRQKRVLNSGDKLQSREMRRTKLALLIQQVEKEGERLLPSLLFLKAVRV